MGRTPKLLVLMLVFVASVLGYTIVMETTSYADEMLDMQVFIELAAEQALVQQQDLYLQGDNATADAQSRGVISAEAKKKIDDAIMAGTVGAVPAGIYCKDLAAKANTAGLKRYNPTAGAPGINDTDLFKNLEYLKEQSKTTNGSYNPIQFGLTYIDKELLRLLFEDNLQKLVDANYNNKDSNGMNMHNRGMDFRSAEVVIAGPELLKISEPGNATAYAEVFGVGGATLDYDAGYNPGDSKDEINKDNLLMKDAMSDYVVQYKITFKANGWHNFKTQAGVQGDFTLFGINADKTNTGSDPNATWRWATINDGTTAQRPTMSLGLPMQIYESNYILVN